MLKIDGSQRSGSGTIVRDAVPYSILIQQDLLLTNVRARRGKPGLRPQHLAAIRACVEVSRGKVHGAAVGSREFKLHGGPVISGGDFLWEIGTAGSTIMLAMSVLPLGLYGKGPSRYRIRGGLFQDFAPSAFAFLHVLLPTLTHMGAPVQGRIVRPGYVPRGGGEIQVDVKPVTRPLLPLKRLEQGEVRRITGVALSSHLTARSVSERMAGTCEQVFRSRGYAASIDIQHDTKEHPVYEKPATQPGACLAVWAETDTGCVLGADMAGARGRTAEQIGRKTALDLAADLSSGATVDRHTADQVIPFAALARGISTYRIPRMTEHIESRLWLAEKILGAKTEVRENLVRIQGIGYGDTR